ncbi:MAG: hypothetical protein JSS54_06750 [Proteobacteria bacterium]|nr:hypothetical protein [Pseudomonadota bacterium]
MTIDEAWMDLVEKEDRTSPEAYPEMALIAREELRDYMVSAAARAASTTALVCESVLSEAFDIIRALLDTMPPALIDEKPKVIEQARAYLGDAA